MSGEFDEAQERTEQLVYRFGAVGEWEQLLVLFALRAEAAGLPFVPEINELALFALARGLAHPETG